MGLRGSRARVRVALGLGFAFGASIAAGPAYAQCAPTDIDPTDQASGSLTNGDCTIAQLGIDAGDTSYVDVYRVTLATDGYLTVTLDALGFDALLAIFDEGLTQLVSSDDDNGLGTNSRIPRIPIPAGTYLILANSFFEGDTGSYTLTTLFELTGNPACDVVTQLSANTMVGGSLSEGDCTIAQLGIDLEDHSLVDAYRVTLPAGGPLTVSMQSGSFDTFLWVFDETLATIQDLDDDSGAGTDALIQDLPLDPGSYAILANACCPEETGPYTLTLIPEPSGALLGALAGGSLAAIARRRRRRPGSGPA